jgi:hypothetical protein
MTEPSELLAGCVRAACNDINGLQDPNNGNPRCWFPMCACKEPRFGKAMLDHFTRQPPSEATLEIGRSEITSLKSGSATARGFRAMMAQRRKELGLEP